MAKNVLITGGSGLIGMQLSKLLQQNGYEVAHMTRSVKENYPYKQFEWDVEKREIDKEAVRFANHIIHLAGASVADKRWTKDRKKVIIESRVVTAHLLFDAIKEQKESIESFISASGISYYGMDTGDRLVSEETEAGDDFLAYVCKVWEDAADKFSDFNIPVCILRTGIVLTKEGGALEQLAQPIKLGFGAALGSGKQYMSWIHLDDICGQYLYALENKLEGVYNAVGPQPLTNKEITKAVAKVLGKPLWLPNVPGFALKLVFGDLAKMILGGNKVDHQKIEQTGFSYRYRDITPALEAIYSK